MSENQNIEDLFKSNLNNLNVEPTSKVWEGVNSNLWYSNIQNAFYNYTVQPTSNAWRKIALRLWFKDFIIFSPTSFNVYYLSSALIICTVLLFSNFNSSIKEISNLNITSQEEIAPIIIKNNSTIKNSAISQNLNNTNKEIEKEESLIVSALNNTNQNTTKNNNTIQFANNTLLISDLQNANIDNLNVHEPLLVNEEELNDNVIRDNSSLLKMPFIYLTNNFNLLVDTSFKLRTENEYYSKHWQWSVESFVMPMLGSSIYKITNNELTSFENNYGGSVSSPTLSEGLLVQTKHLNLSFQTGLSFSSFTDKPDYKFLSSKYYTSMVTEIVPDYSYEYFDEVILNLDSLLLTGDSAWIIIKDSTIITTYDTVIKPLTVQVNSINHKRTTNSFSNVEIPFIAGYTISQGKINFTLRGGIIAGILTSVSGSMPSPYSEVGTIDIESKTTRNFMLSGIAGIEASYNATNHISLIAAPVFRFNLLSLYKKDYLINQRFNNYGIKLGIRYNFN